MTQKPGSINNRDYAAEFKALMVKYPALRDFTAYNLAMARIVLGEKNEPTR